MTARTRILIAVAAVVAALSAGAYAYWHFLLQGPLAGALTHDFGDVPLFEENAEVHHTFRLTNRLERPLTIVAIRPDCGCLTTRDLNRTLAPGEMFELPVTLIAKGGERVVLIRVMFDDDTQATLRVRAKGRYQPRLHMNPPEVALDDDGSAEFILRLDTYETWSDPVPPTFTPSHPSLRCAWSSWTLKYRPKDVAMTPTHWEARLVVHWEAPIENLPADASVMVNLPPARSLSIAVRPPGTAVRPIMPTLQPN